MTPPRQKTDTPSDAILTAPNVITFARLALIPVWIWLALGRHSIGPAWWLGLFIALTDLVDGWVARRFHQVSKLGATLDPLFDRVLVAAGAVILLELHLAPWPIVAIVLVRDAALLATVPLLRLRGVERPEVSILGKRGTFGVMGSFGIFFGSGIFLHASLPRHLLRTAAWWIYVPAVALSYLAAAGYARTASAGLRARQGG